MSACLSEASVVGRGWLAGLMTASSFAMDATSRQMWLTFSWTRRHALPVLCPHVCTWCPHS
eukprot:691102-Rhodomonas_salina.1